MRHSDPAPGGADPFAGDASAGRGAPDLDPTPALRLLELRLGGALPWDEPPTERPDAATAAGQATPSGAAGDARLGLLAAPLPPGATFADARGRAIAFQADETFPAASTIKVYVLQALLERVARGEIGLTDERVVNASDLVSGSGILKSLTPGRPYPLLDIATLMIVVSDNTATNVLIELLGVDAINATMRRHGWSGSHLGGKLQLAAVEGARKRSPSVTTPADLADYFGRLWLGELLPADLTETAKEIYRRQQLGELGRGLDYDSYSAEIGVAPWRIASKSGSIRGVRNDAGVFEPTTGEGIPFVIAVMTKGCPDERFHQENLGARVVGAAAREVHRHFGAGLG